MNIRTLIPVAVFLLPSLAWAHAGGHSESGLMTGLLHPLTGTDHLLAMLAIGIWAALQSVQSLKLAIPATFLAALLAGFVMGVNALGLPMVETGIALSVLLLGLLVASAVRLPAGVSLALAASFALFHGYAHGAEASGSLMLFAAGFLATSLMLHVGGVVLGEQLRARLPMIARGLGVAIATSGVMMMV